MARSKPDDDSEPAMLKQVRQWRRKAYRESAGKSAIERQRDADRIAAELGLKLRHIESCSRRKSA